VDLAVTVLLRPL